MILVPAYCHQWSDNDFEMAWKSWILMILILQNFEYQAR